MAVETATTMGKTNFKTKKKMKPYGGSDSSHPKVIYVQMKTNKNHIRPQQQPWWRAFILFYFFGFSCPEVAFFVSFQLNLFMSPVFGYMWTYCLWGQIQILDTDDGAKRRRAGFFAPLPSFSFCLWAPCCWYNHGSSGESQKAPVLSPVFGVWSQAARKANWLWDLN